MALSLTDVEKIAKLSRLSLTEEEKGKTPSEYYEIGRASCRERV